MESILKQSGDDIDVVYCENDNEAFGAIDAIEAAGYEVGGEEGQILVMSFDTTNAGLTDTLSGKITLDTECNHYTDHVYRKSLRNLKLAKRLTNRLM